MSDAERDKLVVDVADALTLNQAVEWDRCAKLATPAARRSLDNLRLIARVFAGSRAAVDASLELPATHAAPFASAFVRRGVQALIAFSAVQVAAALLLLPWAWDDYHRELGGLAVYLATLLVGAALSAGLFLIGGRRDRRTWLLGAYFLLTATLANPFAMLASLRGIPQADVFGSSGASCHQRLPDILPGGRTTRLTTP